MATSCLQCGNLVDVERFCSVCGAEQIAAAPDGDPMIGKVVAERYQVLELINSGGMGRVYRGVQRVLDRPVAIKCIHPELVTDEEVGMRFLEEARVASRLNHPNIVSIYDFGRASTAEGGYPFLVMEHLSGPDLEQVLAADGILPVSHVVDVVEQTLGALAEAHEHGIAHRDIKPGNIMLEPRRRGGYHVKIIDFGIARLRDKRRLTRVGTVVGTPQYMPPEKLRGGEPGPAADLFAVSVLLYEMLTGELPFPGPAAMDIVRQQMDKKELDPRTAAPDRSIPDNVAHTCTRGLAFDPANRFPDALSMVSAIADPSKLALRRASRFPARGAPTERELERAITRATRNERQTQEAEPDDSEERALKARTPWAKQLLTTKKPFLVWGRPGVGRSWLLRRAVRAFEQAGNATLLITAPPTPLDEIGYGGLRVAIRRLVGWSTEEEIRAGVETVRTTATRNALQGIFGQDVGGRGKPNKTRAAVAAAFRWAVKMAVETTDEGKFVLAIDDVDLLDGASFLAVADLIASARIPGFTLVVTASSALEDKLSRAMVRQELRGWPKELATEKLGEQQGLLQRNDDDIEPMYVEQLIASFEDDSWSAPINLNEAVEQRLRVLPPDALCTLQALAVCGPSAISTLTEMVERPDDVNTSLLPLSELGLVRVSDGKVRFVHDFIGRATLGLAPAGAIAAIHEKATADAVERSLGVELQAYHALRGRPDFEAFLLVEESARLRLSRGDPGSAIAVLQDGIEAARTLMLRDQDEMAKSGWLVFGRKLGELLREVGRTREAAHVLSETLNLTEPDSAARAHMLEQLAKIAQTEGRTVETEILSCEALRIADLVGEHELAGRLRDSTFPLSEGPGALTKPPSADSSTSRPRVLVVEDDRPLARALERWLRRKGSAPTVCHSVAEVAQVEGTFACGIYDVLLPDGSGLELADELMDTGRVAKSVFFTSSEEAGVAAIAESMGAMVRKSMGLLELEAVVDAALRNALKRSIAS